MNKLLTLLITSAMTLSAATFNVATTPELRTALESAATNGEDDTIVLADGTYKTTDDGGGTFIYFGNEANSLTLQGSSSENVILSGDKEHQIFNHQSTLDAPLELENLSFVDGNNTLDYGGAVYTDYTITVINCNVTNNNASNGGGGGIQANSVYVSNSTFHNNTSKFGGSGFASSGSTYVINSIFTNNSNTISHGGGFYSSSYSRPQVINSIFKNNSAKYGGGIYADHHTTLTINNSTFENNFAYYGGAFATSKYTKAMVTNTIINNDRGNHSCYVGSIEASNLLLIQNKGGIFLLSGENNSISNSVFLDNNTSDINGSADAVISNLENNYLDTSEVTVSNFKSNNIFDGVDLGFVDAVNGDYSLTAVSDLIDAGTTSITGLTLPTTDFNGNVRVIGGSIDIGPYEFSTTKPTINSVTYTGTTQEQQELTFTTDSNASTGRSINSVEYDYLNDGTFTTTNTYTYQTAGTYTVNVKVTDSEGEFSSITKTITIAELAFANMTDEQKLLKAIDPTYYNDIIAIIDAEKSTSNASGVTTGENNVVLDPNTYGLATKSDISVTASSISGISTGWTLTSTPFTITDLSMFDTATIIWVYSNLSASWSAYSSDTAMRQKIIDSTEVELLTTIPAGSGVWINK